MRATDILSEEHRVIEQVLNCLEKLADEAAATGRLDAASALEALDFIKVFADECHHQKEEDLLFPALERRGFSRDHGPTGVMMAEHTTGREHVRAMKAAALAVQGGNPSAAADFVTQTRLYLHLLREHILKEDHCLFTMANNALTGEDQEQLLRAFHRVESQKLGEGTHQRYLDLATRLALRLNVPRAPVANLAHGRCGH
jgi:hemerythrin-like domain-containing protein